MFAAKIDPSKLKDIISFENNKETLTNTLIYLKYSKDSAEIIATHPKKFLWIDLLKFFEGKTEKMVGECI